MGRYLNVKYATRVAEINVTGINRVSEVHEAIKNKFGDAIPGPSADILIYNKEQHIDSWSLLNELPQEHFTEGGSCVDIRVFSQDLNVWIKYLEEEPVRILLPSKEMLIHDLKISFISLLNSPVSTVSPGNVRISINSTFIPSNKAISDYIEKNSYESPFLISIGNQKPIDFFAKESEMTPSNSVTKIDGKGFQLFTVGSKSPSVGKSPTNFTPQTEFTFKTKEPLKSDLDEIITEPFKGHLNFIIDIAISQGFLYSCSGDKTIKKWDSKTGKHLLTFGGLFSATNTIYTALCAMGDYLYSTSMDNQITKWDPTSGRKVFDFKDGASQSVVSNGLFLAIAAHQDYLYAVSASGKVLKFEINTGHCISAFGTRNFNGKSQPFHHMIHVYKEYVCIGYGNEITFFKSDTGQVAFKFNPFPNAQRAVLSDCRVVQNATLFTVSGDYIYACQGSIVHKHRIDKTNPIPSWPQSATIDTGVIFEGHTDSILALVIGGSFLFTSSKDNTIKKWDINSGFNVATFSGHLNPVNCLQVSDNFLYSGSNDCMIKKWEIHKL